MEQGITTYDLTASLNEDGTAVSTSVVNVTNIQGVNSIVGAPGATGAPGVVQSVVAGLNVAVDDTDPANPIVSSSGGSGGGPLYFNVVTYGAVGDGVTDSTLAIEAAIDAAINAGGGTVFFPSGNYLITGEVDIGTGISLLGEGSEASQITQGSTVSNGIGADDAASISIQGLFINGPGSGTGVGITMGWTSNGNVPFLDFRDVKVHNFGSDGIAIETPIVSNFTQVVSQGNGGYGFNFYHAGTSCTFDSCWARDNAFAGYHFYESVYMNLSGCASDGNGVGYLVENAQSIGFYACGCESTVASGGDWDGTAFKISNSSVIGLYDVWITANNAIGIWVTNGSIATEIFGAADNSPGGSATAFVQTDVSTNTTLSDVHNTTANSYSPGTVTVVNDGANGMLTKQLTVKDSSGSMIFTAAPDGGDYNIEVDTSGTLAFFGSGGQTLDLDILDGTLTIGGYTLPNVDGTNGQVLETNGSGAVTWQTGGGGGSGITRSVHVVSTATSAGATAATDYVYFVSGTTTVTLPTAVSNTNLYSIKNTDASHTTTIATTSSQTIDGSTTQTIAVQNVTLSMISNGSNWELV